ncbi:MAG: ABC-F family ATP-binding cassette domain-containing protein [Myxococcales bacterium]|nr:ATP-binding cassette domain-containing protein [Myxococcota bacterium]MDW8283745.1 ABC-F family ATP-binding cassette domain-containing protein [Myxococcales bacterium]
MIVQLADVSFAYSGSEVFSGVSLQVNPGDRLGLVGPNGAGKSTLLRLIAGELEPDRGQVVRARGRTLAYMHQSQEFHGHGTLWDTLLQPFADLLRMRQELQELEAALASASGTEAEALLSRYGPLEESYRRQDGYHLEVRVRQLAADLGFDEGDLGRPVGTLSGGERGRVELAKVLLAGADLLLLDEPTNHLDVEAVERLEARLASWDPHRAFIVISHDRYFLRAVCADILDIEELRLVRYSGGYDRYLEERQARLERRVAAFERQQEQIARTEEFIRRNIAGQRTKQAQSRRKMLEKMERLHRPHDEWEAAGRIGLRFQMAEQRGSKEVVRAEGVELGYADGPALVRDLDLTIYRGDRIGIIGPNGAGKTTLLRALIGQLQPRRGTILLGHEVRIGYFDQRLSGLDEERSLIEEIRSIRGDWNEDVVRAYLARFRFFGDEAFRKVKGLSGGERNRLTLAKLMLQPRNLLALDEPTNHLDIPAREVLEGALCAFEGTLLVVSHDRYFLDRVVTRILHIDPATGRVDAHVGGYSDWKARVTEEQRQQQQEASARPLTESADPKQQRLAEYRARRERDRERERRQRQIARLEAEIAEAESAVARVRQALGTDHGTDWQRLHALVEEEKALSHKVQQLLEEWERLQQA